MPQGTHPQGGYLSPDMQALQRSIDTLRLQVEAARLGGELRRFSSEGQVPVMPVPLQAPASASAATPAAPPAPAAPQAFRPPVVLPAPGQSPQMANPTRSTVVVSVRGVGNRLTATLMLPDGSEMPAHVGSVLPDGSTVTAVDRSGVAVRSIGGTATRIAFLGVGREGGVPGNPMPTLQSPQQAIPFPIMIAPPPAAAARPEAPGEPSRTAND
jgi:type IV pilus biogenesis protein PilP